MTTITLSVSPDAKKYIKAKAALEGTTMRDFVLRCVGWQPKEELDSEYTSDDFNEVTKAAMEEDISTMTQYESVEDMVAEMRKW